MAVGQIDAFFENLAKHTSAHLRYGNDMEIDPPRANLSSEWQISAGEKMVEPRGIEPLTFAMPLHRST